MYIIQSPSNNAYFNIALEEYLLYQFPSETIFLLYINAPSIIVGKFQNTLAEINLDFVNEHNIKVVRRMSGGGTVYHDLGNLNFSFHTLLGGFDFMDFSRFTTPVIDVLNKLNIPARLEGRNDLLVGDKKFSGNAKLARNGKMIQHGTLLVDSDMSVLDTALKINPLKYKDKAVKSNRSRVTNLKPYIPEGMDTQQLATLLVEHLQSTNTTAQQYELNAEDIAGVKRLIQDKYETWEWNFGFSPNYNYRNAIKIAAGFIELHMDVHKGIIQQVKVFGDFFASQPIEEFESLFLVQPHNLQHIEQLLNTCNLTNYFGNVTSDEILELFK